MTHIEHGPQSVDQLETQMGIYLPLYNKVLHTPEEFFIGIAPNATTMSTIITNEGKYPTELQLNLPTIKKWTNDKGQYRTLSVVIYDDEGDERIYNATQTVTPGGTLVNLLHRGDTRILDTQPKSGGRIEKNFGEHGTLNVPAFDAATTSLLTRALSNGPFEPTSPRKINFNDPQVKGAIADIASFFKI
ncbi:hypothetical protein HYS00_03990 [Candidatus Microgenomates bacterium]|nr:hypothetical protein [Candidatus Microgenomates bacterium]